MPYPNPDAKELNGRAGSTIKIGYNYRQYLREYQNYSLLRNVSEHTLYNHYVAMDLHKHKNLAEFEAVGGLGRDNDPFGTVGQLYAPELLRYISREQKYEEIFQLTDLQADAVPYAIPGYILSDFNNPIRTENTYLSKNYLTGTFVETNLSSSTINWAQSKMRNMLFDTEAVNYFFKQFSEPLYKCAPYDINLNWPVPDAKEGSEFLTQINNNNFSSKFIKTLYSAFSGDIDELQPSEEDITEARNYLSSSDDNVAEYFNARDTNLRTIEYDKFLTHCRNNFDTTGLNENCMFVGEANMERVSAQEESAKYRFFNTMITNGTTVDVVNFVNDALFNKQTLEGVYTEDSNYVETLAYRIEKIGGAPTGDRRNQNVLQNFWLMNSVDIGEIDFHDTQVKYNTDYTYTVYAYVIVAGTRYSTEDLLLSRDLGCEDGAYVGVEMYDPMTGERTPEFFESDGFTVDTTDSAGFGSSQLPFKPRTETGYGETYQIFSLHQYIADFKMNYRPVLKIVEVPLYSKTLRVLDHPGNRLQISPYQINDDSQRVGFKVFYDYFVDDMTFPETIGVNDLSYKTNYLHANDIKDSYNIELKSVSNPRFVEIYRISEMPTSTTSFDGALLTTIDLSIPNENIHTFRRTFHEDTVATNKKYYYLFRILNQNRTISQLSEIYETQLVNDGGYKYAVFNVIDSRQLLEQNNPTNYTNSFKKIFQLQPNLGQLSFNTDNVDFEKSARSQIENLGIGTLRDLIWDKTFKIRLTSKKTGKRIDLNVTYKLNSE